MIDSAAACVFVAARDLGLTGAEAPAELEAAAEGLAVLEEIRRAASIAMGITANAEAAAATGAVPKVAIVGAPVPYHLLSGDAVAAEDYDITIRMISMGLPHRAIPLTGGLSAATGAAIPGTILAEHATTRPDSDDFQIRIGTPSGVIRFGAKVSTDKDGQTMVHEAMVERTARRLMEGQVVIPAR